MNIRSSLAVLALGLASTMAFAAAPAATPAATTKPATVKHHAAVKCKAGETLVKGKWEAEKTYAAQPN